MLTNNRKLTLTTVGSVIVEYQRDMGIYSRFKLTFNGFTKSEIEMSFEMLTEIYETAKQLMEQNNEYRQKR